MAHASVPAAAPGPGGFVPNDTGLMSPTPSHASSSVAGRRAAGLPHPRRHALRPGSAKEDLVRRYMSERLLHISRRFVKRLGMAGPDDSVSGYRSMGELCQDVNALLDALWMSGTPGLQVQYLLSLASALIPWIAGFPPSPRATLAVLRKLDYCFASLLGGEDLETKDVLPGFEGGLRAGLSRTDMVRCRSIAEETRVTVVDVFRRGPPDPLDEQDRFPRNQSRPRAQTDGEDAAAAAGDEVDDASMKSQQDDADEDEDEGEQNNPDDPGHGRGRNGDDDSGDDYDDDEDMQMGVARVYEFTLVKLGEILGDGCGSIGGLGSRSTAFDDENDDEY